ncbi:MAG TPA: MdtA/MuxA family multidrug efflux RND transporter periplasmic adaptor subunit [Terriglobia bacterium]|jgi:multidrug efflux system membrane fusion protein
MTTSTKLSETKGPESLIPGSYQDPHKPAAPPRKARKRALVWATFFLIIAGVAGYAVWSAGHPTNTGQQGQGGGRGGGRGNLGPVPVVVTKVGRSSIPVYLDGLGSVTAYYTTTVKSRVDGQLMKVEFNEGDFVREGQELVQIDPRPYQVQLDQAQATLARDSAILANARKDLERYRGLVATDAIPAQQLDTQTALVAQDEAVVKQDQANIESANLNLTYSKVTAPITGVVGLRVVDPGNIVHASDQNGMITITQLQPISVLFTVPEDSVQAVTQKLRTGIHLPVDAYNRDKSKKLASGMLVTLDNQIDSSTGTVRLKAVFDNKDNALFPQQFVNVRLLVDTLTNQLVIPNVAVQNGQQGTFVYVVDQDSRVHIKPVKVGITTEDKADILSGITEADQIVVDGTDRLVENAVVRVRKAGELENPPDYDPTAGQGSGRNGRGGFKKGDGKTGKKGDRRANGSSGQ